PLNDRGLAQRLRQYEIRPTVLPGGAQRGYKRVDLHDAWERYLPPLPSPDKHVTSVTSVTDENVTHVTDVTLPQLTKGRSVPNAVAALQPTHRASCRQCRSTTGRPKSGCMTSVDGSGLPIIHKKGGDRQPQWWLKPGPDDDFNDLPRSDCLGGKFAPCRMRG